MSIAIDEALSPVEWRTLAEQDSQELPRACYDHNEPFDGRYLLAVVHRAIAEQTDEAWSLFQDCFSPTVRSWFRSHHSRDVALLWDSEENYIAMTFSRFWLSMRDRHVEFATLSAALSYLHATLNGVLIDTVRDHLRLRSREDSLPEPECSIELSTEDIYDSQHLWRSVQALLVDERQRRLAYLLYYCGLKPRDIARVCSQEFADVKDIYSLTHNILERLRRNSDRLGYLLGRVPTNLPL